MRRRLRLARTLVLLAVVVLAGVPAGRAGERALVDTTRSPKAVLYMPDLADVRWTGGLLGERFAVARDTMVPHMGELMRNPATSPAWTNFRIAAGLETGRFRGPPFNDGDFLKWLEAAIQIYAVTRDAKLGAEIEETVAVIVRAQREDGYLHTQAIIPQRAGEPRREFADREHFETYNMGHLMTTAAVHHRVTGQRTLLEAAIKAADYLERLCREKPQELARNAICPSHYMGVLEIHRVTRDPRYLRLAEQLIEIRSLVPPAEGSDHNQDRMPFRQMTEAVGHAVRANYLYAGVTDVYAENGDATLLAPLRAIADNIATRKLYVTGMTGALYDGASPEGVHHSQHKFIRPVHQAYGRSYQLPNLTAYNETCATIGYGMWLWRMLAVTGDARYADQFEQTLYNGVLPGISLDGKHYFYVNPLRKLAAFDVPLRWSRTRVANIPASFCCPPNVVRTIAEAHNYVYALSADTVWVNLYAAATLDSRWLDGTRVVLRQETDYPWDGSVKLTVDAVPDRDVTLKLRVPGWLKRGAFGVRINGEPVAGPFASGTYAELRRRWRKGDVVQLDLAFQPVLWEANPLIEETLAQMVIRHGPLVYCVESNDLPEGVRLADLALSLRQPAAFRVQRERIAGATVATLTFEALALAARPWAPGELYREHEPSPPRPVTVKAVPYFAWGNRGDTEMTVWLPVR